MVAGYMVYTRSTRSSQFSEGSIGKEAKLGFSYRGGLLQGTRVIIQSIDDDNYNNNCYCIRPAGVHLLDMVIHFQTQIFNSVGNCHHVKVSETVSKASVRGYSVTSEPLLSK